VEVLSAVAYEGYKDASEVWAVGVLAVGGGPAAVGSGGAAASEGPEDLQVLWQERVAITTADGFE
jgi:hypothetical protein